MTYVIVFPGQGSQRVGMGEAFAADPLYAAHLQRVDQILGFELSELMHNGPAEQLQQTLYTQLALFTMQTGLYQLWRDRVSEDPLAVAGHSLGEYSALVAAGAIRFEDALLLVKERAQAMQVACEQQVGSMAAVIRPDLDCLQMLCQERPDLLVIANYNSPKQVVISGESQVLQTVCAEIKVRQAGKVIPLKVSGAFHSPLMNSASKHLNATLASTQFLTPICPVVMNASGQAQTQTESIRQDLQAQICAPVRWAESVFRLQQFQPDHFIEFGANTLTSLIKQTLEDVSSLTLQSPKDLILCQQTI